MHIEQVFILTRILLELNLVMLAEYYAQNLKLDLIPVFRQNLLL